MTDLAAVASAGKFTLPPLPYDYASLAPTVSEETMRTHHDKHHRGYVQKLNRLVDEGQVSGSTLEEVIRIAEQEGQQAVFNNAGQAWNHGFFWQSMSPQRSEAGTTLAAVISRDCGGPDALAQTFVDKGTAQFGSGWVWLVARGTQIEVITTHDAGTSVADPGLTPILTCDVWEHAYYLDYKQDRAAFLRNWFENVANWEFAGLQYAAACGEGERWQYPAPAHGSS